MDDYISRAAAIAVADSSDYVGLSVDVVKKVTDEVVKGLKQLPSAQPTDTDIQRMQDIEQAMLDKAYECGKQDAAQWIPCSERLPEHGGRYLISALDGINRRTTVAPYLPRCKAWAMTGRMAYWKVIAWMPLPEPYGGNQNEE